MLIEGFDGGLNTRKAPQYLAKNQGVEYLNIDNAKGNLHPAKSPLATAIEVGPYCVHFSAEDTVVSKNVPFSSVEYQRKLYTADGLSPPSVYYDGGSRPLSLTNEYEAVEAEVPQGSTAINMSAFSATLSDVPSNGVNKYNWAFLCVRQYYKDGTQDLLDSTEFWLCKFSIQDSTGNNPGTVLRPGAFYRITQEEAMNFSHTRQGDGAYLGQRIRMTYRERGGATPPDLYFNQPKTVWYFWQWGVGWVESETDYMPAGSTWYNKTVSFRGTDLNDVAPVYNKNTYKGLYGTYSYVFTIYNSATGVESTPSSVSAETTPLGNAVQLTFPDTSDADPDAVIRVYRVGGDQTVFTQLVDLPIGTTSHLDLDNDISGNTQLDASDNDPAPNELTNLAEAYGYIFGSVDNELRFSQLGEPYYWPPENSIKFEAPITGIGVVAAGILVFTRTKTHIVIGTSADTFAVYLLQGDQGCINHLTIADIAKGSIAWVSEEGICVSSGNSIEVVSRGLLGDVELAPVNAVVNNEVYYVQLQDRTILAFDYRFNGEFKKLDFGSTYLYRKFNKLKGVKEGFEIGCFEGEENLEMKYLSPVYTEGSYSTAKTYKKVYIRSEGVIILNILINNKDVGQYTLDTDGTHVVQVPQGKQRGYSIQFRITGTGVVHEINYVTGNRENG